MGLSDHRQIMDGPRAARKSELADVIALTNSIFREGTDQSIQTDYPLVFSSSALECMRIIKINGKVVSHVPLMLREVVVGEDRFSMGIISPTSTHPDYRKRGYASLCLGDCVQLMDKKGAAISVLWTQEETFPFYQKSGYEAVASQGWLYHAGPKEAALFSAGNSNLELIKYQPQNADQLKAIIAIHEAEPCRITRSPKEYETYFSLPKINTFLAMRANELAGYLVFGQGLNKPGLIEAGGDTQAVEALVKHVLEQREAHEKILVPVPLSPSKLGDLFEAKMPRTRRPIEESEDIGQQMIRVNSLTKLLQGIKHYLQKKSAGLHGQLCLACRETSETLTLSFSEGNLTLSTEDSDNRTELSRRELTQLIFGPYPSAKPINCQAKAAKILEKIFPFYFPIWELDHS